MQDALGKRMKENYENATRYYLPRRSYTIIRVDGKAFHSFTKKFEKPFDENLMSWMNYVGENLCQKIMGAKFAFVQSDEVSVLITDFDKIETQGWFGNNLQKMCSISASIATTAFNGKMVNDALAAQSLQSIKLAEFDSRVFQIPTKVEVENYFIWRQMDATRNSIQMVAQSFYSHKELHGKSTDDLQEMIFQKGVNWNDYPFSKKRGRLITKRKTLETDKRGTWQLTETPIFTKERQVLSDLIPNNNEVEKKWAI